MHECHFALAALRSRFITNLPSRVEHIGNLLQQHYGGRAGAATELRRETHCLVGAAGIHQLVGVAQAATGLNHALEDLGQRKKVELAYAELAEVLSHPEAPPCAEPPAAGRAGLKIVVVCQGIDELLSLNAHLEEAGHEVFAFTDRRAFNRGMAGMPAPALLIIGLQFGDCELAGFVSLEAINRAWPETRIIVASASDSLQVRMSAYRAGAHLFVAKPYDPAEFLRQAEGLVCTRARETPDVLFFGKPPYPPSLAHFPGWRQVGSIEALFDALPGASPCAVVLGNPPKDLPREILTRMLRDHPLTAFTPVFWLADRSDARLEVSALEVGAAGLLDHRLEEALLARRLEASLRVASMRANEARQRHAATYEATRQRLALEQHCILSLADAEGVISNASENLAELRGHAIEAIIGGHLTESRSGKAAPELPEEALQLARRGEIWRGEIAITRPDGQQRQLEASLIPFLDALGEPYQYLLARTDISALVAAEQALADARDRELETASAIQQTLLVPPLPRLTHGVGVASRFAASQGVAGDFHQLIPVDDSCFDVLIGDVMGKGVPAALVAAAVKLELAHALSDLRHSLPNTVPEPEPADIVRALDRRLNAQLIRLGCFVTLSYLRVAPEAGWVISVGCGHPPGMLIHAGTCTQLPVLNPPIGVITGLEFEQTRHALPRGATLALYSDGLTEACAEGGEMFGEARLAGSLLALSSNHVDAEHVASAIIDSVCMHAPSLHDDCTLVILRLPEPNVAQICVPRSFEALSPLRAGIHAFTEDHRLETAVEEALCLSVIEYVTNLVRHGEPRQGYETISLGLRNAGERVEARLTDAGSSFAPFARAEFPDDEEPGESGRGLKLINTLCCQIDYHSASGLNTCTLHVHKRDNPLIACT